MLSLSKQYATLPNGEKYAYVQTGKGEDLLLIHGNMSSCLHFLPILDGLSKKYRCTAPDLRGFGDSTFKKPFFSMEELADDVKLFADALNIKQAYVVGWSAGGGVALQLAARYPQFTRALFSIAGASHKGYPIYKKDKQNLPMVGVPYDSVEQMATDPVQVAPIAHSFQTKNYAAIRALWDALIYVAKKPDEQQNKIFIEETAKQVCLPYLDWSLACLNMSDTPSAYSKGLDTAKKVKCRTAFTCGTLDKVVPLYMVQQNTSYFSNCTKIEYQDCGHSPLVDCPQRLQQDIANFFN